LRALTLLIPFTKTISFMTFVSLQRCKLSEVYSQSLSLSISLLTFQCAHEVSSNNYKLHETYRNRGTRQNKSTTKLLGIHERNIKPVSALLTLRLPNCGVKITKKNINSLHNTHHKFVFMESRNKYFHIIKTKKFSQTDLNNDFREIRISCVAFL
jgi:hypothetical protein